MTLVEILTGMLKDVEAMAMEMAHERGVEVLSGNVVKEAAAQGELVAFRKVHDLIQRHLEIARFAEIENGE